MLSKFFGCQGSLPLEAGATDGDAAGNGSQGDSCRSSAARRRRVRADPSSISPEASATKPANHPGAPRSVLGRSPWYRHAYFAFGHGHLGLTMGGITGKLLADLIADRIREDDLAAFRADRF